MRNIITTIAVFGLALASLQAEGKDTRAGSSNPTASPNLICPEEPLLQSAGTTKTTAVTPRLLDPCSGDPGGGGGDPGGGGTPPPPPPPFSPPLMFPPSVSLPTPFFNPNIYEQCNQFPHPFFSLGNNTYSNDVPQGTVLYLSGVVARGTQVIYGFYNPAGQLMGIKATTSAGSNCVIAHEANGFDTGGLAPGYYNMYASFIGLGTPYTVQCFFGRVPLNPNFVTPGYQCPQPMYLVTTIRIR